MADRMTTPLARVRGLGAAKDGTEQFWRQRLTAVANVPLVVFFVALVVCLAGADHATVTASISSPWIAIPLLMAVLSVTWHMRLGMQVVIEDYVHGDLAKMALVMANTFFAAAVALTASFAILKLAFAG